MKKITGLLMMVFMLLMLTTSVFAGESLRSWIGRLPGGQMYGAQNMFTFLDIAAPSVTAYASISVATQTLVSAPTTWTLTAGDFTDMITPRNIVARSSSTVNPGALDFTGTMVITGVNSIGNTTTETLNITTNTATGSVAWRSITSIKLTTSKIAAAEADAIIQIGSGVKIGLPCDLVETSNVKKVIEGGSLSTTYTANAGYNTIQFNTAPNGTNDYQVWVNNQ